VDNSTAVVSVVGAFLSASSWVGAAIVSSRAQHRAAAVAAKAAKAKADDEREASDHAARVTADAGAYQRAVDIDRTVTAGLLAELKRLQDQVEDMRKALDDRNEEMDELRNQLSLALLTIDRMRHLLTAHNVPIPPGFINGP
jgi:flagellar motility protein MotE (MotC chaperone)